MSRRKKPVLSEAERAFIDHTRRALDAVEAGTATLSRTRATYDWRHTVFYADPLGAKPRAPDAVIFHAELSVERRL